MERRNRAGVALKDRGPAHGLLLPRCRAQGTAGLNDSRARVGRLPALPRDAGSDDVAGPGGAAAERRSRVWLRRPTGRGFHMQAACRTGGDGRGGRADRWGAEFAPLMTMNSMRRATLHAGVMRRMASTERIRAMKPVQDPRGCPPQPRARSAMATRRPPAGQVSAGLARPSRNGAARAHPSGPAARPPPSLLILTPHEVGPGRRGCRPTVNSCISDRLERTWVAEPLGIERF
jgi:hypothetical protein